MRGLPFFLLLPKSVQPPIERSKAFLGKKQLSAVLPHFNVLLQVGSIGTAGKMLCRNYGIGWKSK
jgi:hypothetical protein